MFNTNDTSTEALGMAHVVSLADKYDGLLSELAKLLIPHIVLAPDFVESVAKAVADEVTSRVGKQIKADLTDLDEERIGELVREELRSSDFIDEDRAREIADEQIADIDFEDQIDERCNYQGYLDEDGVKEVLRNCDITVHIGS